MSALARSALKTGWRAVALDMDGTTLSSKLALTPRTVTAIQRGAMAGLQFVIATGRPVASLQPFVDALELRGLLPAVCFNGACALLLQARAAPGKVLFSEHLSADATVQVLRLCSEQGWCASYVRPLSTSVAPQGEEQEQFLQRFEALEGVRQERVADYSKLIAAGELPLKVVALVDDPESCAATARAKLPAGLVHIIAAEVHVEFLGPTVNKGRALGTVCREHLDIALEQVIAFGDGNNDKEMLQAVGEGVAMANAKAALKEVATRTCSWTNDEEGIARELETMLAEEAEMEVK